MNCKIIDFSTGEEIKRPEQLASNKRAPAKLATRGKCCNPRGAVVQGGPTFEQIGSIAGRIVRRLEAR